MTEVETALTAFEKLLQDSEDLRRLVTSPVFSADEQVKALDAILDKAGIAGLARKLSSGSPPATAASSRCRR